MKSFLVIGMSPFGKHLATQLMQHGNEVMVVDKEEERLEDIASEVTAAQIGDCTKESVLQSLGIKNFDCCFVTVENDFQDSLEITSLIKELGAQRVVSKAVDDTHEKFLKKNGADEVVFPLRDTAEKIAVKYSEKNLFDYIELSPDYSISEIPILSKWAGHSIEDVGVRTKFKVTILAVKRPSVFLPMPGPDYVFRAEDHLVVMGRNQDIFRLTDMT